MAPPNIERSTPHTPPYIRFFTGRFAKQKIDNLGILLSSSRESNFQVINPASIEFLVVSKRRKAKLMFESG